MHDFLIDQALYHAARVLGPDSEVLVRKAQEFLGMNEDNGARVLERFHGPTPEWGTSVWQQLYDASLFS